MILNAVNTGLIFAILGFGIFLSFRVLSFTDLTAEASFTLGAALAVQFIKLGLPHLALLMSFIGGAVAGFITAFLHTKLKIDKVLSGILTLTAFYTINLLVTNFKPSLTLAKDEATIFVNNDDFITLYIMLGIIALLIIGIYFFFRSRIGLSIRACGDNEVMMESNGVSSDLLKTLGLMLSNGLIALSGGLFMSYSRYYDSTFGTGMMVVGVATIIIGEIFNRKRHYMLTMLIGIVLGSIIYRFIYLLVIQVSGQPQYMKLFSALAIIIFLILSRVKVIDKMQDYFRKRREVKHG
ncbi:MAG: ABC transporter permease [Bacilli bacterium]|nr:ABC transporter permease [Bacilli bacterium]